MSDNDREMGQTTMRLTAHFQPQAWVRDQQVDIDGAYEFDITDQIREMGREGALAYVQGNTDDYLDGLWRGNAVSQNETAHRGPFLVTVDIEAVRKLFDNPRG